MSLTREGFEEAWNHHPPAGAGEEDLEPLLEQLGLTLEDLLPLGLLYQFPFLPTSEINRYSIGERGEELIRRGRGADAYVILAGKKCDLIVELGKPESPPQADQPTDREAAHRIAPNRRALLVQLERVVSSNVYNVTAHGHAGALRNRRYPIVYFHEDGEKTKITTGAVPNSIADDQLLSGCYVFGANHLHVMQALEEIIQLLKDQYGFTIEDE